jgi:hypothetical protein
LPVPNQLLQVFAWSLPQQPLPQVAPKIVQTGVDNTTAPVTSRQMQQVLAWSLPQPPLPQVSFKQQIDGPYVPPDPPVNTGGGGGWRRPDPPYHRPTHYLWEMHRDVKPSKKKEKDAELAIARAIGETWDKTFSDVERVTKEYLRGQQMRVKADEREQFGEYLRGLVEAKRENERQEKLAVQARQDQEVEAKRVAQQTRNKRIMDMLIAIDRAERKWPKS